MRKSHNKKLLHLDTIRKRITKMAKLVGATRYQMPSYGSSREDGSPHIEVGDAYFYVVREYGKEFQRRATTEIDELLYWIFDSVTFSLACDYEVDHRRNGEDFRRQLFAKQIELLELLSPEWATRHAAEHQRILEDNPFDDG